MSYESPTCNEESGTNYVVVEPIVNDSTEKKEECSSLMVDGMMYDGREGTRN